MNCLKQYQRPIYRICAPRYAKERYRFFFSAFKQTNVNKLSKVADYVHVPVLLNETIELWSNLKNNNTNAPIRYFVDGTVGLGGHSKCLLQSVANAQLLCIDRDPEILEVAQQNLREFSPRVHFALGSYMDIQEHLHKANFPHNVDGILVDLGANSYHFDAGERGFSFTKDGPLDMRYNQRDMTSKTAAQVLLTLSEVELTNIFREYGEEYSLAKEFAKAIIRVREDSNQKLESTRDLADCISRVAMKWRKKKKSRNAHAATKCFQALRIYVNDELQHVTAGVKELSHHLKPQGRLVTIAFHSLEDRPIKQYFRSLENTEVTKYRLVHRKPVKPTVEEIEQNPRARSARLRTLERL